MRTLRDGTVIDNNGNEYKVGLKVNNKSFGEGEIIAIDRESFIGCPLFIVRDKSGKLFGEFPESITILQDNKPWN